MANIEDKNRSVVPRCRPHDRAVANNELEPLNKPASGPVPQSEHFASKVIDWNFDRSAHLAAELLSSAIILDQRSAAVEAAEFILSIDSAGMAPLKHLAQKLLHERSTLFPELKKEALHDLIRRARNLTRINLRDAYTWSDLAFAYTSLGAKEKGLRAMRVAYSLFPNDRFILRSASRLLLHNGLNDEAQRILKKSSLIEYDPWVLSAEIATSSASGKQSRLIKQAAKMLDSQRYEAIHYSELNSALGTVELEYGSKKGRKLLRDSLCNPTENATAQAAWASRSYKIDIDDDRLRELNEKKVSPEALSFEFFLAGNWPDTLDAAKMWWLDQPFSSRPPLLISYVHSTMGEYGESIEVAKQGLVANPDNTILLNNKAYGLAMLGKLPDARSTFSKISKPSTDLEAATIKATAGLLAFREGRVEEGEKFYQLAISEFQESEDTRNEISATLHYIEEEIAQGQSSKIQALYKQIEKKLEEFKTEIGIKRFLTEKCERIRRKIEMPKES